MKRAVKFQRRKKRNYRYPETHQLQSDSKKPAIHAKLLKIFDDSPYYNTSISKDDLCDLEWYPNWLERELSRISSDYLKFSCHEPSDSDSEHYTQPHQVFLEALDSLFWKVWHAISGIASAGDNFSIDYLVEDLTTNEKVFIPADDPVTLYYQRQLVFAVLGRQSMLYLPSPKYGEEECLGMFGDVNQVNSGLVFEHFSHHTNNADKNMYDFLKRYGNILPVCSSNAKATANESSRVASTWSAEALADLNIDVLSTILHIRIQWVDIIALHLDYDKGTRTLSLFRYPSICVAALRSKATLYSFAMGRHTYSSGTSRDDIPSMLREILSSYRLLFGHSKKSRQYFTRQIRRLHPDLFSIHSDKLLIKLCYEKTIKHSAVPSDRSLYFAKRDFPILGFRLKLLVDDLTHAKPKTWLGLLRDRRDIIQYWTFWLVAIFGSLSVLLGIVQAVLQGLALRSSVPALGPG